MLGRWCRRDGYITGIAKRNIRLWPSSLIYVRLILKNALSIGKEAGHES